VRALCLASSPLRLTAAKLDAAYFSDAVTAAKKAASGLVTLKLH